MAKKKKKSRASGEGLSSPPPKSTLVVVEDDIVDLLSLQIVPPSTPPVKALPYTPMILLDADDADQLDVVAGDDVFLLAQNSDNKMIYATARARVHVANVTGGAAAKSPSPQKLQRSKLSPGYCHVFPATLALHLQQTSPQEEAISSSSLPTSLHKVDSTPARTLPTAASPSPSKSKFSFARGGGGDRLIESSPVAPKTPTTVGRTKAASGGTTSNKHVKLWVVPVESSLGDELDKLLCAPAAMIQMRLGDEDMVENSSSATTTTKILSGSLGQQLIRAHLLSSYVSTGNRVAISVQGQSTLLLVATVVSTTTGDDNTNESSLESDMAALSINGKEESGGVDDDETMNADVLSKQLLSAVRKSLIANQDKNSKHKIRLCKITSDTNIIFGDNNDESRETPRVSISLAPKVLLAGLDDTIARVQSLLLTPLLHPSLFLQRNSSLRPPKGVLLYGASGSGKSTLALQVAQTLRYEHKIYIQEISCAKLQSQTALVGQAEQELVRLFESATRNAASSDAPASLVVLDDVHLICPRRQGMNVGADRLAATLLALLDGLDSSSKTKGNNEKASFVYRPVMVLAATNNPSLLDPALRRPGRLDTEVEVPLPDEPTTRSEILQFHIRKLGAKVSINEDTNEWVELARLAKGFTGADLQLAVKEAIRVFAQRNGFQYDDSIDLSKQDLESAIRSIKPSAIKAVTVEIPQVQWTSIGGMEDVKRQLREAIELPLTHGAMFEKLGIRPPRGVLLYGPPGCSKTLMARALATEGRMNFLAVKGPELLSKWLGESERALASLFRRARLASPSVIFFDEVDAIATKRGGGNAGGGERLLSQLLTELDGIQTGSGKDKTRVVVVCATNRPDLLDGALMRPGRIDRMIYVGVPDRDSRLRILELALSGKACGSDVDVSRLADDQNSGGLSGAEIVSACRDAALLALEESETMECNQGNRPSIGMRHMLLALKGIERQITQEMIDFYTEFQGTKKNAG